MVDIMDGPGTGVTATTDAAMRVVATDGDTFGVATVVLTSVVEPIVVARSAAAQSTAAVVSTVAVDTVADTANGNV